jgi:tRNA G26 N,N-dimethylase Trm1
MEQKGWEKDQNPYLIVTCLKCKQYMYVKTTQKTKKCLRCGRQHTVSKIISLGEIVKGMTKAVEMVKTRQNELAVKELGSVTEFRADYDFTVRSRSKKIIDIGNLKDNNNFSNRFTKMLQEISGSYTTFPFYVLEIMAENFRIPLSELKILVKTFQKKGILIRSKDNSYRIKTRDFHTDIV